MKTVIWKFPVPNVRNTVVSPGVVDFTLDLPLGTKIVDVGIDPDGHTCFWGQVDLFKSAPKGQTLERRRFLAVWTGVEVNQPDSEQVYVGRLQMGDLVWHFLEVVERRERKVRHHAGIWERDELELREEAFSNVEPA